MGTYNFSSGTDQIGGDDDVSDIVTISDPGHIDLDDTATGGGGSGVDSLVLGSFSPPVNWVWNLVLPMTLDGFELLQAGAGDDTVILNKARLAQFAGLEGGDGQDVLQLSGGLTIDSWTFDLRGKTLTGFETLKGSAKSEKLIVDVNTLVGVTNIGDGGGSDTLYLGGDIGDGTVGGTYDLTGKTWSVGGSFFVEGAGGNDIVVMDAAAVAAVKQVHGGAGDDTLRLVGDDTFDFTGFGKSIATFETIEIVGGGTIVFGDASLHADQVRALMVQGTPGGGATVKFNKGSLTAEQIATMLSHGVDHVVVGDAVISNVVPKIAGGTVAELSAAGTVVGTVALADPTPGLTATFTLLNNAGGRFILDGDKLKVVDGAKLDFEQAASHQVTIRSDNGSGTIFDKTFTIAVGDVNPEVAIGTAGIDTFVGGGLADSLSGRAGDDVLTGGAGNDKLFGEDGNDKLTGGVGNDFLFGGLGKDALTGGAGKDTFVFDKKLSASNLDTIADFNVKDDSFQLDNAIFKKLGKGTPAKPVKLGVDAFFKGKAAEDKEDRILYDKGTGALSYDADGIGSAKAVKFAILKKGLALTNADFFVI